MGALRLVTPTLDDAFAAMSSPSGGPIGADGHLARLELVQDLGGVRSVFEFGGHFGHGLVTWLHGFPGVTWAGWSDNEGAFAGSNAHCLANVRRYLGDRPCELWWCERPVEAALYGVRADLVLVDGDHSHEATLVDLALAYAMRPKAVLVDDTQLPNVMSAVEAFSAYSGERYELRPQVCAGTAVFRPAA